MINMGRWGLGTYAERRHLRTAESARPLTASREERRRTLRCLVTSDYESSRRVPDSTLHRLDTMGLPH